MLIPITSILATAALMLGCASSTHAAAFEGRTPLSAHLSERGVISPNATSSNNSTNPTTSNNIPLHVTVQGVCFLPWDQDYRDEDKFNPTTACGHLKVNLLDFTYMGVQGNEKKYCEDAEYREMLDTTARRKIELQVEKITWIMKGVGQEKWLMKYLEAWRPKMGD